MEIGKGVERSEVALWKGWGGGGGGGGGGAAEGKKSLSQQKFSLKF